MLSSPARVTGLVAAAAVLLGASPALATVTHTQITTPSSLSFLQYDGNSSAPQTFTVSGTSDGNLSTADKVDIRCYYASGVSPSYTTLAPGVAVQDGGSFTTTTANRVYDRFCDLRAVPTSASPSGTDLQTKFAGPKLSMGYVDVISSAGKVRDFDVGTDQAGGGAHHRAPADGALKGSYLFVGGRGAYPGNYFPGPWSKDGSLYQTDGGVSQASEIVVDGHNAYTPYAQYQINAAGAGRETDSLTQQIDQATGVWTATDNEPLAYCYTAANAVDDTYNPSPASCDHFVAVPVTLVRNLRDDRGGRQSTISDDLRATDGVPHTVRLAYEQNNDYCYFQFPGHDGSNGCNQGAGTEIPVPAKAPATIYSFSDDQYAVSPSELAGAITYLSQPDRIVFDGVGGLSSYQMIYSRTVPSSGALNVTMVYNQGTDRAEVTGAASDVEDRGQAPAVAITSPAPDAVVSSDTIAVTGTASDNVAVKSLTVNGTPTVVGPDGNWSQTLTGLAPGTNTITAVATDGAGNSTQASETVVYSPPEAPSCTVPALVGQTKAAASAALVTAGCSVGNLTTKPSNNVAKGSVLKQAIASHTKVSAFYPVGLTISSGRQGPAHLVRRTLRVIAGKIAVTVACPKADGNPCNGTLKIIVAGGRNLGKHAFQVPAGKSRKVFFRLSNAAKRRLAAAGTTKANVYIIARNLAGKATFIKIKVKIKD